MFKRTSACKPSTGIRFSEAKQLKPCRLLSYGLFCIGMAQRRDSRDRWAYFQDLPKITTTKSMAFGLALPSVSFPCNKEGTRMVSLAQVIFDWNYWGSCWGTNQNRDDVVDHQWMCRISSILRTIPCRLRQNLIHVFFMSNDKNLNLLSNGANLRLINDFLASKLTRYIA